MTKSLTEAGYRVTRLGIKTAPSDPDEDYDDMGTVIRLQWPPRADAEGSTSAAPAAEPVSGGAGSRAKRLMLATAPGRSLQRAVHRERERRVQAEQYQKYLARSYALGEHGARLAPDLVIASQLHALPGGLRLAEFLGIPLIYDARDLVTEAGHQESGDRRFERLEKRLIRKADSVLTVSPQLADRLSEKYSIPVPLVIYNSSVKRVEAPTPPHSPVRLLFQGAFQPNRCLGDLVEAMTQLRGVAVLTLQGWGPQEQALRRQVADAGLNDWVRFAPPAEPMEASIAAGEHDIGVINYRGTTENLRAAVPNKLFDYLGGGLAVLASDLPGHRDVLESAGCGVLFEPTGPQAIVEAVRQLASDVDRLLEMKRNAWRAWETYAWEKQGERVVAEVSRLLARDGHRGTE